MVLSVWLHGEIGSADLNRCGFGSFVVGGRSENDRKRLVTGWCSRLWHQRKYLMVSTGRAWDRDGSVVAWVYGCTRSILDQMPWLVSVATMEEFDSLGCDGATTVR